MRYKEFNDDTKIPLKRPESVSEEQWSQAKKLYYEAKRQGDKFPELTVAQAALETGWFKSPSGRYNYFGQKAAQNQQGTVKNTHEVAQNQSYATQAKFRDYNSLQESVKDRVNKWGTKYAEAGNLSEALYSIWKYDPKKGQGTGYATDDKYDQKIFGVLNSMGVDTEAPANSNVRLRNNSSRETYQTTQDTTNPDRVYDKLIVTPNSGQQQTAQDYAEQEAPQDSEKTAEARRKINERSFIEEYQAILQQQSTPQEQQVVQTQQPQDDSAWNYIDIETYQDGGERVEEKVKKFHLDYINSPKYKERLESSGYRNPDVVSMDRSHNIHKSKYKEQDGQIGFFDKLKNKWDDEPYADYGSVYKDMNDTVIFNTQQPKEIGVSKEEILAHEYSHVTQDNDKGSLKERYNLNGYDTEQLTNRLQKYSGQTKHDTDPTESKADMDAFRFFLKEEGLYDAGKEDFTQEHLQKSKSKVKNRLLKNYSEEDLIWLMNNIADTSTQQDNFYAKKGGTKKRRFK